MGPDSENVSQPSPSNSKGFMFWLVESPKAIHGAENRQQARLLSALLLALLALLTAGLVATSIQRALEGKESAYILASTTLLILFTYGLSRTRYNYNAGALALLTLSLYPFGEILVSRLYDNVLPTLIWLILPILLGTLLLRLCDQVLLAVIDVFGLAILAVIGPQIAYRHLLITAGLVLSTSVTLIVLAIYQQRMESNQQSELLNSNQSLEAIRTDLENQVAECTRSVEDSRLEAEAAHRALEAQTWQISGLTELDKMMHGVQTIPSLASSIMKQVCRYADIPVGALFITDGDALRLMGCYAYPFPTSPTPRFKLGSGLVGEAARERQVISMRDIPDNYLPITSGLGEATPAQILAVPCIYQEQVVGVMELASLEPFSIAQIQFITASMEFIASALHTAQIRTRIDALLIETQHRTDELLIQKEEQQQINLALDRRETDLQRREKRLLEQQIKLDAMTAESKGKGAAMQGKMEAPDDD